MDKKQLIKPDDKSWTTMATYTQLPGGGLLITNCSITRLNGIWTRANVDTPSASEYNPNGSIPF